MNERQITLQIKGEHLDAILSGEKTVEYRDITDHYIDMFVILNDDDDTVKEYKPVHRVKFINGYKKNARTAVFEVLKVQVEEWLDEKGEGLDEYTFAIYLGNKIE